MQSYENVKDKIYWILIKGSYSWRRRNGFHCENHNRSIRRADDQRCWCRRYNTHSWNRKKRNRSPWSRIFMSRATCNWGKIIILQDIKKYDLILISIQLRSNLKFSQSQMTTRSKVKRLEEKKLFLWLLIWNRLSQFPFSKTPDPRKLSLRQIWN